MVSRTTTYNRARDLETLRKLIPHEAPIIATQDVDGFAVEHLDGDRIVRNAKYHVAYVAIVSFLRGLRSSPLAELAAATRGKQ